MGLLRVRRQAHGVIVNLADQGTVDADPQPTLRVELPPLPAVGHRAPEVGLLPCHLAENGEPLEETQRRLLPRLHERNPFSLEPLDTLLEGGLLHLGAEHAHGTKTAPSRAVI